MRLNLLARNNPLKSADKVRFFIENVFKFCGLLLIGAYRTLGTQFMGGNCKFHPSCSEYAAQAFHTHSPFFAIKLVSIRLCKCRPFSTGGYDPVPDRSS
ncbi:MAG: membrane protein insertion efficiency factor YidD [Bdellovibrionaceae bacterium]|nr:membrane protein insertion efficiency factor YidD [Pseudobdellovibrionaceae bacterium]